MDKSISKGFVWVALEKFSIQIVQFVLGIIIARYITPAEYGILGVMMVFINISQVFIDSGLGSALIYKNDLNEDDLQTSFTFNFAVSLVFVLGVLLASPLLESILEMNNLKTYLSFSIIVLILNAFIVVPTSILTTKMEFRSIAVTNFISTLISGALGATFAFKGLGIWALIIQLLSKSAIQVFLLIPLCKWFPHFYFKKESFLELYKYGIALFGTSCITKFTGEGISLFIAKILTPYNLGIFTRANQFASLTGTSLGSIFSSVLFPAFSSAKNKDEDFHELYNKMIIYQGFIIIPIFFLLALISKPLVIILLTEKWIDVVPILQILCIGRILSTISIATEQAICASGRSDLEFKQQLYKILIKLAFIAIGFIYGIIGIAIADAFSTLLSYFITNHFAKKCEGFSVENQVYALLPFILFSSIAFTIGCLPYLYFDNNIICICLCLLFFTFSYIVCTHFFKKNILKELTSHILLKKIKRQ